MLPWITDRLPTAEDADSEGFVVYIRENGGVFTFRRWWEPCILGTPWLPYSPPPQTGQQPQKVPRKIDHLHNSSGHLVALANDGTLWILGSGCWRQLTLPDREEP